MSKLVAYLSFGGVTKKVAEELACVEVADLFEIKPAVAYTKEDMDYRNPNSRCTVEMTNLDCRPALTSKVDNLDKYDIIFVGFPIWWGREPSAVDTFLDENCLCGKTVIPFCTSGGSPIDGAVKRIAELTGDKVTVKEGKRLGAAASEEELKKWVEVLGL